MSISVPPPMPPLSLDRGDGAEVTGVLVGATVVDGDCLAVIVPGAVVVGVKVGVPAMTCVFVALAGAVLDIITVGTRVFVAAGTDVFVATAVAELVAVAVGTQASGRASLYSQSPAIASAPVQNALLVPLG